MSDAAAEPLRDRLPTLTCPRLRLRWIEEGDVDDLFALFGDPKVTRFWSWPAYTKREQAAALVEQIHACFCNQDLYQWGIIDAADDRLIGTCTLARIDRANRRAEIGFALASARWGSGFMLEATSALVAFAFGPLGLCRLEADVDPRNEASLRLLERLGFAREGHLRERWRVGDEVQDSVLLGLLAREWRAPPAGVR